MSSGRRRWRGSSSSWARSRGWAGKPTAAGCGWRRPTPASPPPCPTGRRGAAGFYKKSADALRATLADLTEDGFLPSNVTPEAAARGVKLRLAEVLGGAGEYEPAYAAVSEVLAESPNALNAQVAAADLLADWGRRRRRRA